MSPHPLAARLIEHLRATPNARVVDFASGSGRNAAALRAAGYSVVAIDDRTAASPAPFSGITGSFAAAISTHGLLHGTPATIAAQLTDIASHLERGAPLYATFGSVHDARFGSGERVDEYTYAPEEGDERGVAHSFFDRAHLSEMLETHFTIEFLDESDAGESAGAWAHREPLRDAVHWFAIVTAK